MECNCNRCAGRDEPERVREIRAKCSICNEPIFIGQPYYEFEGERYCADCFYECAAEILLDHGAEQIR